MTLSAIISAVSQSPNTMMRAMHQHPLAHPMVIPQRACHPPRFEYACDQVPPVWPGSRHGAPGTMPDVWILVRHEHASDRGPSESRLLWSRRGGPPSFHLRPMLKGCHNDTKGG